MQRRDFLALTGLTAGGLIVPSFFGKAIAAEQLQSTLDPALKKRLADAALQAARSAGASYPGQTPGPGWSKTRTFSWPT